MWQKLTKKSKRFLFTFAALAIMTSQAVAGMGRYNASVVKIGPSIYGDTWIEFSSSDFGTSGFKCPPDLAVQMTQIATTAIMSQLQVMVIVDPDNEFSEINGLFLTNQPITNSPF